MEKSSPLFFGNQPVERLTFGGYLAMFMHSTSAVTGIGDR